VLVGIKTLITKFGDYDYESIRRMLLSKELSPKIFRRTPKSKILIELQDFENYIESQKRVNAERMNPAFDLYPSRGIR